MNHFLALGFRNLWLRKTRTLLTTSGILLGVSAMLAVSVMSASTTQSLKDFFAQASGRAHLTVTDAGTTGEGIPERALLRVQNMEGVAAAVGTTTQRALLLAKDKETSLGLIGIDPDADPRFRTYTLTAGRMLDRRARTQNVVLAGKFAANHKIALGETITLALPNGSEERFNVIGLVADEGAGHLNGGSVGFLTLQVSQDVFGRGSRLDAIDVMARPEVAASPERLKALKEEMQNALGGKYVVGFPAATGESVSQALTGLNLGLGLFSVIALFVGGLLIYNTFAMSVAERTREMGLLRALGATQGQVLTLVLGEALLLGAIGAALGVGGGLLLAIPLVQLMGSMIGLPLEGFVVPPEGVVQSVVIGLICTVVAAGMPAWQASRISPTEALRARGGGREGRLMRHGWKIGLVLIALGGLDGLRVFPGSDGTAFLFLLLIGAILLMPGIIVLLERVTRVALAALYGPMGQLGSRNLVRSKGRTSLTVGVLMVGVVMIIGVGAMSQSFHVSMDDWIQAALGGDFIITSSQPMRDDLLHDLMGVEGIAAVTPERWLYAKMVGVVRGGQLDAREDPILLVGIDLATRRAVNSFQFTDGEEAEAALAELERGDAFLVSTSLRDRWNIQRGDLLRLRTARGEHDFKIAGMVVSFMQGGQSVFTTRRELARDYGDERISVIMAKKQPSASSAEVEASLKNGIGKSRHLEIQAGEEYRRSIAAQVEQFFLLFDAMVWIAILIGALGVVNTMTMNVLERVREIGALRSIGMTRGQLVRMILSEAAAMGVLGALFGVLIGYAVSRDSVNGMSQGSGFPVTYIFPSGAIVAGVMIALFVSQGAALYPTWRAGRVHIIEAIKEE